METAKKKSLSPALSMSYAEKQARALEKKAVVLDFLASGEVWTVPAVVAEMLGVSERRARYLLKRMEEEYLIKIESDVIPRLSLKLYGISAHGRAMCETAHPDCKEFLIGRTNYKFIDHHVEGQLVRIRMEKAGWKDFVPGSVLYGKDNVERKGKIVPDFLATRPDGRKIAGEIERNCKTEKRQADVFAGHLLNITSGKYDYVYYFSKSKSAQQRAFDRVDFIVIDNKKIKLNDSHRARFKIFEIENYKGEM